MDQPRDPSALFAEASSGTPTVEPSPAKQAARLARAVHALAAQIEAEPERKGRLNKIHRLMREADATAGVGPDPDAPELGDIRSGAYHHALAAFYRRHRCFEAAIAACAAGAAVDPHDMGLRRRWLEALRAAGRLEDAGPVLDIPEVAGGPSEKAAIDLLSWAAKLLRAAGAGELAFRAMERAGALRRSGGNDLLLAAHAEAIGDQELAAAYRGRIRGLWDRQLPERLADGLAALWALPPPADPSEAALAWAWALADKQTWSRDDWRRALDWGARANGLLIQWWSVRPEQVRQIGELIDAPDLAPLRAAQASGRAQIVASSHLGPSPAAVHLLEASGLPFRILGGNRVDRLSGERGTLMPVTTSSSASRELIRELRRAAVLAVAADSPIGKDRLEMDFLGRTVAIKSLPARLAQRHDCDTWWYQPLWRGDRIVIELERLPDPEPDEPEQQWAERWARAYLKRVKRVMRGDPRNFNLNGGVWRFAEARAG